MFDDAAPCHQFCICCSMRVRVCMCDVCTCACKEWIMIVICLSNVLHSGRDPFNQMAEKLNSTFEMGKVSALFVYCVRMALKLVV